MLFEKKDSIYNERRKMNRLKARAVSFVLFRFQEPIIGQLNDISLFGASVLYFMRNEPTPEDLRMDIFTSDNQFVLKYIPFTIVTDARVPMEIDLGPLSLHKRGVRFRTLSKAQRTQLKNFIRLYGMGESGETD